jgi:hypothetical protein
MASQPGNVNDRKPEEPLLHVTSFEGELRFGNDACNMRWSVTIGKHGGIALAFEPVDLSHDNAWLFKAGFPEGRLLQQLSIRGTNNEGVVVESDHVYLLGQQTKSDETGSKLVVTGDASRLRLVYAELPKTCDGVRAVYLTVGMRAFGAPSIETSIGRFTLAAPTTLEDPDHVCGQVHARASEKGRALGDWLADSDRVVGRILDMLSFCRRRSNPVERATS